MNRTVKMEMHYRITNEAIEPGVVNHGPSFIGTYVAHASLRPREPRPLTREELSQYPELPENLQDLLVKADSDRPVMENPLAILMDMAPAWASEGMSKEDIVKNIQMQCNVMFSMSQIQAAHGMARDAVDRADGKEIFTPKNTEADIVSVPLREDVPSVIEIVTPGARSRYELLTPERRRLYGITTMAVLERDFTTRQTERIEFPSRVQMHAESDEENSEIIGEYDD